MRRPWVGVDFDGTLAEYVSGSTWPDVGKPIPEMVARVRAWIADGVEVRIMTARAYRRAGATPEETADTLAQVKRVRDWCSEHLGAALPVTCTKDYDMLALYDDRAIGVAPNRGWLLSAPHDAPPVRIVPELPQASREDYEAEISTLRIELSAARAALAEADELRSSVVSASLAGKRAEEHLADREEKRDAVVTAACDLVDDPNHVNRHFALHQAVEEYRSSSGGLAS